MSVDWACTWGGDLQFTPAGDIATVQDTVDSAAATQQRLYAMLLTNPTLRDENGIAIGRADDLFNTEWGAGLPTSVGEPLTDALARNMAARIESAIAADTGVATSPAPRAEVLFPAQGVALVNVYGQTTQGVPFEFQVILED